MKLETKQKSKPIKIGRLMTARAKYNFQLYSLCILPILWIILFCYVPMFGVVIAFKNYKFNKGILGSDWVGFKNFEFFLKSNDLFVVTRNTLLLNTLFIVTSVVGAVLLAVLLYNVRSRRKTKVLQTVYITPNFVSWVTVAYVVYAILNPQFGILNSILKFFGLAPIDWYSESKYWPWILTIVNLWKNVGMDAIVYYAALMGIDDTLIEAAKIDGASGAQTLFRVIIPSVMPSITICTFLSLTNGFKLFDQNLALTGGQPFIIQPDGSAIKTTEMLALNIYSTFYGQGASAPGYAQAKAVIFFILVAALGLLQLSFTRKREVQQ